MTSEPTTKAGRALLDALDGQGYERPNWPERIVAIEQEAHAAAAEWWTSTVHETERKARAAAERDVAALREGIASMLLDAEVVERAIWPDGPAHGHGSGVYSGWKARLAILANPAAEPKP